MCAVARTGALICRAFGRLQESRSALDAPPRFVASPADLHHRDHRYCRRHCVRLQQRHESCSRFDVVRLPAGHAGNDVCHCGVSGRCLDQSVHRNSIGRHPSRGPGAHRIRQTGGCGRLRVRQLVAGRSSRTDAAHRAVHHPERQHPVHGDTEASGDAHVLDRAVHLRAAFQAGRLPPHVVDGPARSDERWRNSRSVRRWAAGDVRKSGPRLRKRAPGAGPQLLQRTCGPHLPAGRKRSRLQRQPGGAAEVLNR
jgi:hypothetical protein